jgi:hypothetical protein
LEELEEKRTSTPPLEKEIYCRVQAYNPESIAVDMQVDQDMGRPSPMKAGQAARTAPAPAPPCASQPYRRTWLDSAIGQEREVHWALQRLDEVVYRHMHDTAEIAHEHMSTSKLYWMARSDKSLLRLKRVEYVRPGPGLTGDVVQQHNTT